MKSGNSRNPLLIGSTVLTPSPLIIAPPALLRSQSPPNRVNGSHHCPGSAYERHLKESQSPPNRVNGSHKRRFQEINIGHLQSQSPPNRVNGSHLTTCLIRRFFQKSRNPLLIGSTVLTRALSGDYLPSHSESQSPPNRVNGSHTSRTIKSPESTPGRNPLLIGSTVLTPRNDSQEGYEGI